ncbi:MAG: gliding motility protein GldL [Bacteroidetes bacterium]|nr:gliding motility protein GldL [Bacteroidota bacterium]
MSRLYGWGASVVILGALFKINHYPGADYMLIAGLGTESLIFFFSGFEPPYVEPDWSLVYPELAGLYHDTGVDDSQLKKGKKKPTEELDDMLANAKIDQQLIESLGQGLKNLSQSTAKLSDISDAAFATNDFVRNIKDASKSAGELSTSYRQTSEVLNKDIVTAEDHFNNLKNASQSVANLSSVYSKASESLKGNLSASDEFSSSIKAAVTSANTLAQKYTESADKISKSTQNLSFSGTEMKDFNDQLKKMTDQIGALNANYELQLLGSHENVETGSKLQITMNQLLNSLNESVDKTSKYHQNLSALNEIYDKHLKGTGKQVESTTQMQASLEKFLENLNASTEMTSRYRDEVNALAQNIAALNKVYGNMLSAMNVKLA